MKLLSTISNIVNALWLSYGNRKTVTMSANNVYTTGYSIPQISVVAPYGMFAIPNDYTNCYIASVNNSGKSWANLGYLQSLPNNSPISITKGEFAYASNNWALVWNNNGLRANKLNNPSYLATLPSGEWIGYMMLNRITELENMITEINNNYTILLSTFNAHVHQNTQAQVGSTSGTPASALSQTPLPTPSTLSSDTTAINNQNYLLNDNAMVVP